MELCTIDVKISLTEHTNHFWVRYVLCQVFVVYIMMEPRSEPNKLVV